VKTKDNASSALPTGAENDLAGGVKEAANRAIGQRFTISGIEFNRLAYSQSETAALLGGVTRQHVANLVARGEIRVVRLGRRPVIPATEIARLLCADAARPDGPA
jgi:excisionase family DNA binding protein